jgi:uncharacterized lipoprotein YmbA
MKSRHQAGLAGASLALAMVALAACGGGAPPPQLYVLGDGVRPQPEAVSQLDDPVVEIKRVRLPDYLDTSDIVLRADGGRIVASQTGRWGERLSVGVTRVVAASLGTRLPQLAVTTTPPLETPHWQVLIDVEAFEAQPGGPSVLSARWSLREGRGGQRLREERISLTAPIGNGDDAAVVAAMSRQLDELVGRIAPALESETLRLAANTSAAPQGAR